MKAERLVCTVQLFPGILFAGDIGVRNFVKNRIVGARIEGEETGKTDLVQRLRVGGFVVQRTGAAMPHLCKG